MSQQFEEINHELSERVNYLENSFKNDLKRESFYILADDYFIIVVGQNPYNILNFIGRKAMNNNTGIYELQKIQDNYNTNKNLSQLKTEFNKYFNNFVNSYIAYSNIYNNSVLYKDVFYTELVENNSEEQKFLKQELDAILKYVLDTLNSYFTSLKKLQRFLNNQKKVVVKDESTENSSEPATTTNNNTVSATPPSDSEKSLPQTTTTATTVTIESNDDGLVKLSDGRIFDVTTKEGAKAYDEYRNEIDNPAVSSSVGKPTFTPPVKTCKSNACAEGWGVKFESSTKDYYLKLLPVRSSIHSGTKDIPNALPGLAFKFKHNVKKIKVPGSIPVYQNLGIDSLFINLVGCFTGSDGEDVSAVKNSTNPFAAYDSYRSFQDFYNLAIINRSALTVTVNMARNNLEDTHEHIFSDAFGNPKFTGMVKAMEVYHAREGRTYYAIQFEITQLNKASSTNSTKCDLKALEFVPDIPEDFADAIESAETAASEYDEVSKISQHKISEWKLKENKGYIYRADFNCTAEKKLGGLLHREVCKHAWYYSKSKLNTKGFDKLNVDERNQRIKDAQIIPIEESPLNINGDNFRNQEHFGKVAKALGVKAKFRFFTTFSNFFRRITLGDVAINLVNLAGCVTAISGVIAFITGTVLTGGTILIGPGIAAFFMVILAAYSCIDMLITFFNSVQGKDYTLMDAALQILVELVMGGLFKIGGAFLGFIKNTPLSNATSFLNNKGVRDWWEKHNVKEINPEVAESIKRDLKNVDPLKAVGSLFDRFTSGLKRFLNKFAPQWAKNLNNQFIPADFNIKGLNLKNPLAKNFQKLLPSKFKNLNTGKIKSIIIASPNSSQTFTGSARIVDLTEDSIRIIDGSKKVHRFNLDEVENIYFRTNNNHEVTLYSKQNKVTNATANTSEPKIDPAIIKIKDDLDLYQKALNQKTIAYFDIETKSSIYSVSANDKIQFLPDGKLEIQRSSNSSNEIIRIDNIESFKGYDFQDKPVILGSSLVKVSQISSDLKLYQKGLKDNVIESYIINTKNRNYVILKDDKVRIKDDFLEITSATGDVRKLNLEDYNYIKGFDKDGIEISLPLKNPKAATTPTNNSQATTSSTDLNTTQPTPQTPKTKSTTTSSTNSNTTQPTPQQQTNPTNTNSKTPNLIGVDKATNHLNFTNALDSRNSVDFGNKASLPQKKGPEYIQHDGFVIDSKGTIQGINPAFNRNDTDLNIAAYTKSWNSLDYFKNSNYTEAETLTKNWVNLGYVYTKDGIYFVRKDSFVFKSKDGKLNVADIHTYAKVDPADLTPEIKANILDPLQYNPDLYPEKFAPKNSSTPVVTNTNNSTPKPKPPQQQTVSQQPPAKNPSTPPVTKQNLSSFDKAFKPENITDELDINISANSTSNVFYYEPGYNFDSQGLLESFAKDKVKTNANSNIDRLMRTNNIWSIQDFVNTQFNSGKVKTNKEITEVLWRKSGYLQTKEGLIAVQRETTFAITKDGSLTDISRYRFTAIDEGKLSDVDKANILDPYGYRQSDRTPSQPTKNVAEVEPADKNLITDTKLTNPTAIALNAKLPALIDDIKNKKIVNLRFYAKPNSGSPDIGYGLGYAVKSLDEITLNVDNDKIETISKNGEKTTLLLKDLDLFVKTILENNKPKEIIINL